MSIIASLLTVTSCSNDENELEGDNLATTNESSKTSGATCSGSDVDFGDLKVETSWISNDKSDRDTYDACGVDGEIWMDKYSDGRVMLKCLSGDGHRTELKEDTGDEASLNNYKKIKFTGKYTSIPEHGVTIAQIHNRNSSVKRPWIRVYIDSDRIVRIKETETTPNKDSSDYSTYDGPKYTSGASMTIQVWTGISGKSEGNVSIETGGNSYNKTLTPSSDWSSYSSDYYLKAGVYTEGDNTTATVKYDYFSISH